MRNDGLVRDAWRNNINSGGGCDVDVTELARSSVEVATHELARRRKENEWSAPRQRSKTSIVSTVLIPATWLYNAQGGQFGALPLQAGHMCPRVTLITLSVTRKCHKLAAADCYQNAPSRPRTQVSPRTVPHWWT